MAENLRLAHARNAARFKALRSGTYQPKIHHFQVGDFVFVISPEDQVPGGALGIPLRDEILRVVEVRPSGVLLLENQGGRSFTRHVEQCVPCNLSNVEGTVHPDLIKPSWKFPCSICGDHKQGAKMLLCDGCNLGFHTFCLTPPLDEVPDGVWLCDACTTAGVTPQQVEERRARYIPVERSRPRIEIPSDSRRRDARALADVWHGAPVKHVTKKQTRYGRVVFTEINSLKWFKIFWSDGTTSLHDKGFLGRLEIIPKDEAPEGLIHKPDPIVIMVTKHHEAWSIQTKADIKARLCATMPGDHDDASINIIFDSLKTKVRKGLTEQHSPQHLEVLNSTLHLDVCKVILDPWAANKAVRKGLKYKNAILCLNDKLGAPGTHLALEPLEAKLYHHVINAFGQLNAIVMAPPGPLCDFAFVNALEFASQVVCMLVPDVWVVCARPPRRALLEQLERESRLLVVHDVDTSHSFCWVCVFASPSEKSRLLCKEHVCGDSPRIFVARCVRGTTSR